MKKVLALILSLVLVAGVVTALAACGGKEDTNTPSEQVNNDENQDTKKDTIVVGYTIYEPMNYKDENGELVGFDTELAKEVFGNLGYEVVFTEIQWDNKYVDLNSNTIDCVWNGFTANTADDDGVQRSEKVDFSYNYMENRQVVVVKKGSGIAKEADLKGKIGIAESGSAGEAYAKAFEGTQFKGFTKQTDCLVDIKAGTADFAVVDAQLAKSYVGKGDYADLEIIDALSSDVEYYAIGFKKGSDLTAKVNAELEALAADGTIAELAEKYGVSTTAITDFSDQKK